MRVHGHPAPSEGPAQGPKAEAPARVPRASLGAWEAAQDPTAPCWESGCRDQPKACRFLQSSAKLLNAPLFPGREAYTFHRAERLSAVRKTRPRSPAQPGPPGGSGSVLERSGTRRGGGAHPGQRPLGGAGGYRAGRAESPVPQWECLSHSGGAGRWGCYGVREQRATPSPPSPSLGSHHAGLAQR